MKSAQDESVVTRAREFCLDNQHMPESGLISAIQNLLAQPGGEHIIARIREGISAKRMHKLLHFLGEEMGRE